MMFKVCSVCKELKKMDRRRCTCNECRNKEGITVLNLNYHGEKPYREIMKQRDEHANNRLS